MILEVIAIVLSGLALCMAFFTLWYVLHKADEKADNELYARLRSLAADMTMLIIGCFLVCLVVFGCVHMFRLWNTGRLLITAVSKCSDFLSAAVWPLMILLLVIIYRKHVVNAMEKIPKFIENYHASEKVTAAESSDDEEDSEMGHAPSTMALIEKGSRDTVDVSKKRLHKIRHTVGAAFADYVLTKLQREMKEPIRREVNLFSNKFVRFDGAVVRGERITGIEVCYCLHSCEKKLLIYENFYRSLSEKDQKHFDLILCVRGDHSTYARLENLRGRLSFPVEFRCFQYEPEERGDTEKCTSIETQKKESSTMIKKEIAKQCGFELDQCEIDVLCYIWTNTPKTACNSSETYVDLGVPPSGDYESPFTRITIALGLADKGLLQQHQENVNSFRLTETGEKLHAAFYK